MVGIFWEQHSKHSIITRTARSWCGAKISSWHRGIIWNRSIDVYKRQELNSHQIARIILKMRYETATEEEKRVLEAWMKAGDGRQAIYDRIVSDESLREYRDLKAEFEGVTDYGKLQSDILGTLAKRNRQRKLPVSYTHLS